MARSPTRFNPSLCRGADSPGPSLRLSGQYDDRGRKITRTPKIPRLSDVLLIYRSPDVRYTAAPQEMACRKQGHNQARSRTFREGDPAPWPTYVSTK